MRILLALFGLIVSIGAALAVDGTDLPGHNFTDFEAPSAFVCRTSCGGEALCQAYTWVKPGIQGPNGHCWLKNALPAIVKDPCCDSGPRSFISARDLRAEDQIDRPGLDFKDFAAAGWQICQSACAGENACMSWSFRRPAASVPGHCWLKHGVAHPVTNAAIISGVKFRLPAVRFDNN